MITKPHPKTARTQAIIKKIKSLILKENPPTQRLIASELGMSTGTPVTTTSTPAETSNTTETTTTPAPSTTTTASNVSSFQDINGDAMDTYISGIIESPPLQYISYSRPDSIISYKPPFDNQPFDLTPSNSEVSKILRKVNNSQGIICPSLA
ncbi:hypothetical protein TNCV_4221941 [Trichonephila clavipes]|nr:hypothetical protein TNCV_4221941 [Trichonephila clavipes]